MQLVVHIPYQADEEISRAVNLARHAPSFTMEWTGSGRMSIAIFPRVTEGVTLSDHRLAIPRGGLGRDRRPLVHGPPVVVSSGDSDRGSIGMAEGSGDQAGACDDPSSFDPDPRSHHRASRRADRTDPHGEPNHV